MKRRQLAEACPAVAAVPASDCPASDGWGLPSTSTLRGGRGGRPYRAPPLRMPEKKKGRGGALEKVSPCGAGGAARPPLTFQGRETRNHTMNLILPYLVCHRATY